MKITEPQCHNSNEDGNADADGQNGSCAETANDVFTAWTIISRTTYAGKFSIGKVSKLVTDAVEVTNRSIISKAIQTIRHLNAQYVYFQTLIGG